MRESIHLYILDFDRTLTENQTNLRYCYNPPALKDGEAFNADSARWKYIQTNNIKPKIAEMFRAIWSAKDLAAIVTHCDDQDVVIEHLKVAGLTDDEISKIIIKTWQGGDVKIKNHATKNAPVKEVIEVVGRALISGLTFVDDSMTNCVAIKSLFEELNIPGSIIYVDNFRGRDGDNVSVPGHKFIDEIIDSAPYVREYDKQNLFYSLGEKIEGSPSSPIDSNNQLSSFNDDDDNKCRCFVL